MSLQPATIMLFFLFIKCSN